MKSSQRRWSVVVVIALVAAFVAVGQDRPRRERRGAAEQVGPPGAKSDSAPQRERVRRGEGRSRGAPGGEGDVEVAALRLNEARAENLGHVLHNLFRGSLAVSVDEHTNTLIVASARHSVLSQVRELVESLDTQPTEPVFHEEFAWIGVALKSAYAPEVAERLEHLLEHFDGARFVADERANVIWIVGEQEPVALVREIVEEMDAKTEHVGVQSRANVRELHFYELKHAEAPRLAGVINEIARAMDAEVWVVADPASGTLLADVTPAEHAELAKIVQKLDVPPKRTAKASARAERRGKHAPAGEQPPKE